MYNPFICSLAAVVFFLVQGNQSEITWFLHVFLVCSCCGNAGTLCHRYRLSGLLIFLSCYNLICFLLFNWHLLAILLPTIYLLHVLPQLNLYIVNFLSFLNWHYAVAELLSQSCFCSLPFSLSSSLLEFFWLSRKWSRCDGERIFFNNSRLCKGIAI